MSRIQIEIAFQYGSDNQIVLFLDDEAIEKLSEAIAKKICENYQVDVPNTGYFGIIVKKEP